MPYRASPDTNYIMEASFELLEQTPDVAHAAFFSGVDLDNYFDTYDAYYSQDGSSASIKNLCSSMHEWTDAQDDLTRGVILSSNIYEVRLQLDELITGVTNDLIESYLLNNGIREESDSNFYFTMGEQEAKINIFSERDILFPANIATAIMQNNRSYDYMLSLKNRLQKTLETQVPLSALKKQYTLMRENALIGTHFTFNTAGLLVDTSGSTHYTPPIHISKETVDSAKKAIKKGVKKFSNLFGKKNINSFISGDGFIVEGKLCNWFFKQKKSVSLLTMTHSPLKCHIPYQLTLMDKNDVVMADCCVYVTENTPIIDQLITIILYIQHDEEELLANCNLFNVRPEMDSSILYHNSIFKTDDTNSRIQNVFTTSEYTKEFNRLNTAYRFQVKQSFSDIIGIRSDFFQFLLQDYRNPVLTESNDIYYLDQFSGSKLINF